MPVGFDHPDIGERYEILGELGQGSASRVFKVHDRLHDARRALKLATRRGQVRRYQTEYRISRELRHPNIVRSYDFGITRGRQPYYTMELIRGMSLSSFPERDDPEALAVVAMQILDALATLHARGWVHRDIKPKNLLVVGHGTALLARLIDFGLLAAAGLRSRSAGTLPYMAPEVARGLAIDGRADLYSLGMVLYEALLPDDIARTVEDVARRHSQRPVPPSRINPVIPRNLSDFIMRLVDPDPDSRFPDALCAADALARLPGNPLRRGPSSAAAQRLLKGGAVSHRPPLIRRLRKLAREMRHEQSGRMIVIEGETGVGKTPFLRELDAALNLDGLRVIRVRTTQRPASPITRLLRMASALAPHVMAPRASERVLLDPRARLSEVSAFAGQIGISIATALGQQPTAVLIDDLHCAEPIALEALRSLADELSSKPLLVVCAGDQRSDGIHLPDALGLDNGVITLTPLTCREVRELAAHRLRGLQIPAPALDRLLRDSQGMPSLVEKTLARLLVERTIECKHGRFLFAGGRYHPASHSDIELLTHRLAQVHDEHRDVLWAAAVLAKSLDAPRVARIADRSIEETGEILAELARLDILVPTEAIHEPCYGFAHRSWAAATYQKVPAHQRRVFHDRAAEVIADDPAGLDERAEHLLRGSDDARAVEAAIDAGDRAASIYADRRAIAYYARAYARLSGIENPYAAPLAMRLGRLFERSGELERASAWYGAAVTQTTEPLLEIEATLGLGAVAHVRGLPADTEQHAERALELLKNSPDARLSAIAHRLRALVAHQGGDSVQAEVLLMATLAELESAGAEKEIVEVLLDLARLSRERGEHIRAVRYARRAQHQARARGNSSAIAEASTVLGRGFIRAARFRAAKRALLHGLRVARESGDRLRQGLVLREIGNLKVREGDLEGALERYNRSLELLRASRARPDESAVVHNIGVVRSCLGDYRAALTALQAAIDVSNAAGDIQGIASSTVELGHTYAQLGDLRQARALLGTALQIAGTLSDSVLAVEANALLGWVHVRSGNISKGQQFIARLDRLLDPLEDPAHRGVALLYATRCAILLADADTASKAVERLSAVVDEGSLDDLRPATTAARGQAAALAGDREQAIDLLTQAAMQATNHGLRPLEIHVRAALGRLLQDSDQAAVQLTRAMELMRDIARSLSTHHVSTYLSTPEALQINEDFRRAHTQLLGCPPPAS